MKLNLKKRIKVLRMGYPVMKHSEKIALLITGMSLPLVTARIELPVMSLSLFMLSLVLLIFLNARLILHNLNVYFSDAIILSFLIVALASLFRSENIAYGIAQWIKLTVVIVLFVLSRALFYKKPYYVEVIMRYSSLGLAGYLLYLMWYYLVIFEQTYIGIETAYATRAGKNSLAFVVCSVIPYTLVSFSNSIEVGGVGILDVFVTLVSVVGAILIQSRALFLIIGFYLLVVLKKHNISLRTIAMAVLGFIILVLLVRFFAPSHILLDITTRFRSIILLIDDSYVIEGSGAAIGVGSIESRRYLIDKGLHMFTQKPIFGNGLGSFRYFGGISSSVSHNDYVQIIAEQGLVGLAIFLVMIVYFNWRAYSNYRKDKDQLWILLSITGISIYLLMINAYDNIIIWTLLAIVDANYRLLKKNL